MVGEGGGGVLVQRVQRGGGRWFVGLSGGNIQKLNISKFQNIQDYKFKDIRGFTKYLHFEFSEKQWSTNP